MVFTAAPAQRRELSRAPSVEREDQRPRRALRPEPNDRDQVACADLDGGCPNGASQSSQHRADLIEEAMIVEFRRRTLLPLDDVMGCLKDSIPNLTRSSLHRCLERHGISRLPTARRKLRSEASSQRQRLAMSTSITANCAWLMASCTCSWRSIACRSSPMSSSTIEPRC